MTLSAFQLAFSAGLDRALSDNFSATSHQVLHTRVTSLYDFASLLSLRTLLSLALSVESEFYFHNTLSKSAMNSCFPGCTFNPSAPLKQERYLLRNPRKVALQHP